MKRKLFNLASIGSLLVFCLGTAVIWSLSVWGDRSHQFIHLFGPWSCSTSISRMGMQIVVLHHWTTPVMGPVATTGPGGSAQYFAYEKQFPHYYMFHGPFGFEYGATAVIRGNRLQAAGTRTWLMFPFRLFAGVFLLLPGVRYVVIPIVKRLRAKRRHGLCKRCGYDLTGNVSGVCPECGSRISPTEMVAA
jgi:hypothetical protein